MSDPPSRRRWLAPVIILLVVAIGVPLATVAYHARLSHKSLSAFLRELASPPGRALTADGGRSVPAGGAASGPFKPQPIGDPPTGHPLITHVAAADLDEDDLLDVLVCDGKANAVSWIRQYPPGTFTETVIGPEIIAPAHTQAFDIDRDGDLDVLVAALGMLFPNNDRIGSVIVLENDGGSSGGFRQHVIAEKLARVADVRGGDLDGDGDIDLAVAQFGANDGETCWFENQGEWQFALHTLQSLNGTIHCEVVDMDADDDLDIVTIVSQEWEEAYVHENDGKGGFTPRLVYGADNDDYGSSGIDVADLDGDGDFDIAYANGDALDYTPPRPRPWHGVQWLENTGTLQAPFTFHRLADFPGAYSPITADLDGDDDQDIIAVSGFNRWELPSAASLMWLENAVSSSGAAFVPHDLATAPTHLITVDAGDFNRDGRMDLVTGGVHFYPPYDRLGRVTLWVNGGR